MKKFISGVILVSVLGAPVAKKQMPMAKAGKAAGHAISVSAKAVAKFVSWPFRAK